MAELRLVIVIPVYDDWESVRLLLPGVDRALGEVALKARVLLVDDGSEVPPPADLVGWAAPSAATGPAAIELVEILRLRRNLSHQRAIAIGLCHIHDAVATDAVLVMDADGEDRPEDVPRLIEEFERHGRAAVVFAARAKRSENPLFRVFYQVYKGLHRVLTGRAVRVGNFSVLSARAVGSLTVAAELWNHYAAAVFKLRLPAVLVPLPRGRRLAGESRMNFVSLVVHGLSAISVYGETVGARLLAMAGVLIVLAAGAICAVVGLKLFTGLAIPGWATYAFGLSLLLLTQAIMLSVMFVLMILNARQVSTFLPARDYGNFVADVRCVYRAAESLTPAAPHG